MFGKISIFIFLSIQLYSLECLNILVIYEIIVSSHFNVYRKLFTTLTANGHNLTVISFFPQIKPLSNFTDVSLVTNQSLPVLRNSKLDLIRRPRIEMYGTPHLVAEIAQLSCETLMVHPNVRQLIEENNSYDVILREVFNTNCHNGLAKKFKAPVIGEKNFSFNN